MMSTDLTWPPCDCDCSATGYQHAESMAEICVWKCDICGKIHR